MFLTTLKYTFTGRRGQARTLERKHCPVGGNIGSLSPVLLSNSPPIPGLGGGGGGFTLTGALKLGALSH